MGGAGGSWEETPPPLPSGAKWGGAGGSWEETPPPLPSGATDLLPIPFEGFAPNSPTEVIRAFTRSRLGRALTAPEEPPRQPDVPEFMTMEEQRRRAMGFPEKPIYRPAESFMDWLVHGAGKVAQYALPHKFLPGIPKPGVSPSVESARLPEASAKALKLQFIEGKTQEEIAASEGTSVSAVKTRVHRAKKLFRKSLGDTSYGTHD